MTWKRKTFSKKRYRFDPRERPMHTWLRRRRCAQCFGMVRARQRDGGLWEIYCPKGCEPGGHVSDVYVDYFEARNLTDAAQVAAAYPGLIGSERFHPDMTAEEIEAARIALYGE